MTLEQTDGNRTAAKVWLVPGLSWTAVLAVLLFLYSDAVAALVRTWSTSPSFEHGYAVVAVSLGLIALRRRSFDVAPYPAVSGLGLLLLAALAMAAGMAASVLLLQQLAFVAIVQASVLAVFGWPFVRRNLFPLLYLYFAVPFGDIIILPLRDVAAVLTVEMLALAGIEATLDGYLIRLPSADYRIAEACAGLRFFIVGLAVSLLAAYLMLLAWWRRFLFLALALAVPILGNALRAASVIYLEQQGLFDATTLFGHLTYGLGFTSVLIAVLLLLAYAMRDRDVPPLLANSPPAPAVSTARTPAFAVLAVLLAAAPALWLGLSPGTTGKTIALSEPNIGKNWHSVSDHGDGWRPLTFGADAELWKSYVDGSTLR